MTLAFDYSHATGHRAECNTPTASTYDGGTGRLVADYLSRREQGASALEPQTLWAVDLALLVACKASPELLEGHVLAALDDGMFRSEIIDAVTEAALYAGLAATEQSLMTVLRVLVTLDLAGTSIE